MVELLAWHGSGGSLPSGDTTTVQPKFTEREIVTMTIRTTQSLTFRSVLQLLIAVIASSGGLVTSQLAAQTMSEEDQAKFFETKIRPVLVRECYGCHSSQSGQARGGLLLDTRESSHAGGDSGPAVVPGSLDESLIISSLEYEDYRMPPGGKLSANIIRDFRTWVENGAFDPRELEIQEVQSEISTKDIERGREFWSFVSVQKLEPPTVDASDWAASTIDRFVLAKFQEEGIQPAADADPLTLLRRLALDLTGVPASDSLRKRFLEKYESNSEHAIEYLVDSLLASESFGERWGRHWLDVARYAESSGKEVNMTYPHAWRYRDYVIDSFNDDRPYDEFLRQQIAGDLLPIGRGPDAKDQWSENLVATGFLAIGTKTLTERNGRQFDLDLVDEQIDVLGSVVLGVSVACARCHDHKFDPIPQADYYALAGIFQSTDTYYGTLKSQQNRRPTSLITLPSRDSKSYEPAISRDQLQSLKDQLADAESSLAEALRARRQGNQQKSNKMEPMKTVLSVARASGLAGFLRAKINSYAEDGTPLALAMGVQDSDTIEDTRLLVRGEFDKPADVIPRGFPQVLTDQPASLPENSSGRRELAQWLTDPKHPLTARVMANRVWGYLLGQGIVTSTNNFGSTGATPTHPELLDYLASQFVQNGWSVKKLIREIATSRVYRLSSEYDEANYLADPDNQLLWRHQPRRLEAEVIRDCMLAMGGQLDQNRPQRSLVADAGPAIVREGALNTGSSPDMASESMKNRSERRRRGSEADSKSVRLKQVRFDVGSNHRSIYLPILRDQVTRAMNVLDFADPNRPVGEREESNTPDQGLYFLNNPLVIEQSKSLAKKIASAPEAKSISDKLQLAFESIYGRPADRKELRVARNFCTTMRNEPIEKQLSMFCQALFASAEFRYTR